MTFVGDTASEKIVVVHLGVSTQQVAQQGQTIRKDGSIIVMPAVLLPYKGHEYALDAARLLLERGRSNFRWRFYGEGILKPLLAQRIRDLGLTHVADLAGGIDNQQIRELYRTSQVDMVVLTSAVVDGVEEGIPVALMEAMSYGIPVIATDSGDTEELIGDGAGIVIPQRNAEAVADAIEQLMASESLRRELIQKGLTKIDQEFNIASIAQQLAHKFYDDRE